MVFYMKKSLISKAHRQLLSLALVLVMIISLIPATVFAEETDTTTETTGETTVDPTEETTVDTTDETTAPTEETTDETTAPTEETTGETTAPTEETTGETTAPTDPEEPSEPEETEPEEPKVMVAKIGETEYETLNAAIATLTSGSSAAVTLLCDVDDATGIKVPTGVTLTIDFAGHAYTLTGPGAGSTNTETNGFQFLKDSNIVMKNGTVRIAAGAVNIRRIIQNYANLTLSNMTFYSANQVGGENYCMSFNNGNITFSGNTSVISSGSNVVAFDVYYWTAYPNGTKVTFDSSYTGTVNGKIMYDSTDASKAALTVNGNGKFGEIVLSKDAENLANANITISGGKFANDVSDFATPGNTAIKNEDGSFSIGADKSENGTAVAEVNGYGYTTVQAAVNAIGSGTGTIKMFKNSAEDVVIPKDANITLDIASGVTLTNVSDHTITNKGTLTVTGSGTIDNVTHGKGALVNYGTATVSGCTLTRSAQADGNSWYVIDNQGTMTITGSANVINNAGNASLIRNGGVNSGNFSLTISGGTLTQPNFIAVKNDDYGQLTVTGGTINSNVQAIQNWSNATITGGTMNGDVNEFAYTGFASKTTISGSAVINGDVWSINYGNSTTIPALEITGGTVNGSVYKGTGSGESYNKIENNSEAANITISGGSFSEIVPEDYCAEGFKPVTEPDKNGNYTVCAHDNVEKIAAVEATCTESGSKEYYHCTDCNRFFEDADCITETTAEKMVVAAKGHTAEKIEAKAATCTEDGNKEYFHCSVCDKYFSDAACTEETTVAEMTVKALGHTFGDWEIDEKEHKAHRVCSVCKAEETKNAYTVTYKSDDGAKTYKTEFYVEGDTVTVMKWSKSGYVFQGWSNEKDSEKVAYKADKTFEIEKDMTFYAVWKEYVAPTNPKTGDNSFIGLWTAVMVLTLAGASALIFTKKKTR